MAGLNGAALLNAARLRAAKAAAPDYVIPDFGELWQPDLTYLPNGWAVAVADIGPPLAEAMLALNADNQRKVIAASVGRFSADMGNGCWRLTHQGIAFNRPGALVDGQNRLRGVVDSGATVPLLVFFGIGEQPEMVVIDTGKARTAVDAGHVLSLDVDKNQVATITQMVRYARIGRASFSFTMSHSQVLAMVDRYGGPAREVNSWFHNSKVRGADRAPIRAAILAALICGHHATQLQRFVGILTDRLDAADPADAAPKLLRQFINNNSIRRTSSAGIGVDLFLRTASAVAHALAGNPVKTLRPVTESPFVLPELT